MRHHVLENGAVEGFCVDMLWRMRNLRALFWLRMLFFPVLAFSCVHNGEDLLRAVRQLRTTAVCVRDFPCFPAEDIAYGNKDRRDRYDEFVCTHRSSWELSGRQQGAEASKLCPDGTRHV